MPLEKGYSEKAIGKNIGAEERAGRPRRQAVAIAMNTARQAAKRSKTKRAKAVLRRIGARDPNRRGRG